MKGIVFNLLEEVVTTEQGQDVWDDLLDSAGVSGAYTALGSYPDDELVRLVTAASEALGQPPADVLRWFGRATLPLFASRYAQLFSGHRDVRSLVLALNEVIHPEVHKLYPGAETPEFDFEADDPEVLIMRYRSPRRLCAFAEGLLHGAADHYRTQLTINHPQCMIRGDDCCVLELVGV